MRNEHAWAAGLTILLLLLLAVCSRPLTHARELAPATPPPPDGPAPTPTPTAARPQARPPAAIPNVISQPVPAPTQVSLPTVVSPPAPLPTPFPDAPQIVDAVLGTGSSEHWANYRVAGSFTARGTDEQLALAGNVGDHNEVRWVIVGHGDGGWRLTGTSDCLGSGLDPPPSFPLPPDVLDLEGDGRQELLSHSFETHGGRTTATDTLYRWDGHALAAVWQAPTAIDGPAAGDQDEEPSCRVDYRAAWEWADLDGEGLDEIRLRDHLAFVPSAEDGPATAGAEDGERAFRWDGEAFRPYAPGGPDGTFAYVDAGELWLWQDHAARPLGAVPTAGRVQELRWSPDGSRLAWWSQPPPAGATGPAILGTYDRTTGERRAFAVETAPTALRWAPDGRLAYAPPDRSPVLLDPPSGLQEPLPVPALGTWSPGGYPMAAAPTVTATRRVKATLEVAYQRDGNLYVYDTSTGHERSLVAAPATGGAVALAVRPDPAWSPRGDWIACRVADRRRAWVALVAPALAQPLTADQLAETPGGWETAQLQLAWSPDGAHLAALAIAPPSALQPAGPDGTPTPSSESPDPPAPSNPQAVLYLAAVPRARDDSLVQPAWQAVLELEMPPGITTTVTPAWSPDGERLALAAGAGLWEITAAGEPTLRHRFPFPRPRWTTLEWAPDGSGLLAGLEGGCDRRLYWFPAGGGDPVLLLIGALGTARWAPDIAGAQAEPAGDPPIVLVEYGNYKPRLHVIDPDGAEITVRANGASRCTGFQIGGRRVYYPGHYVEGRRVRSLRTLGRPGECRPPLVSPDGERLAWLCDDGAPDWQALVEGTAETHFRLIVTDGRGRGAREVWHYVEGGPDYRSVHPLSWGADGTTVYLSRPKVGVAWAYFPYNPGILALDVDTGRVTHVGDLNGVHDGRVSPDGAWLVQSRIAQRPEAGETITLRPLAGGTERTVPRAPGTVVAGDFSFSPGNTWLAWREWSSGPAGPRFAVRVLRLPGGEPFTVYEAGERTAPRIGGWLSSDDLVLVHPLQQDGTGEHSSVVRLPATGPGYPFSDFVFVGVWGGER